MSAPPACFYHNLMVSNHHPPVHTVRAPNATIQHIYGINKGSRYQPVPTVSTLYGQGTLPRALAFGECTINFQDTQPSYPVFNQHIRESQNFTGGSMAFPYVFKF